MNPARRSRTTLLALASLLAVSFWTQPMSSHAQTRTDVETAKQRLKGAKPDVLPKILVHAQPFKEGDRLNCFEHTVDGPADVVTQAAAPKAGGGKESYFVYVMLSDFDTLGVSAVQFGIAYDPELNSGVDVWGWQDCADLEFRNEDWPMAGTGNLMTWHWVDNCQKEEPMVIGFFLVDVYGDDEFRVIPRPVDNLASMVHCNTRVQNDIPREDLGKIGFGESKGFNPWLPKTKP